jgi:hypothetical protein
MKAAEFLSGLMFLVRLYLWRFGFKPALSENSGRAI